MTAVLRVEPLSFPWQTQDPFLFCVHHNDAFPAGNEELGPEASLAGRQIGQDFANKDGWNMYHGDVVPGFPGHPHRGFETVTVVRSGLIDHSDSLGATARFGGGDTQWLTAGKGIVHAEMFPLVKKGEPNPTELFQIWLNLPSKNKMVEPYFSMLWADAIPHVVERDDAGRETEVTVIAGSFRGATPPSPPPDSWASSADADVAIWTLRLAAGAQLTLPAARPGTNRTVYFFVGGKARVGGTEVTRGNAILVDATAELLLENGDSQAEFLVLQGRPIGEPVVQYGPFVMNTRQEIEAAFRDYQRTQFGGWPFDRADPVHPAERGRFARHADGRIEEARALPAEVSAAIAAAAAAG
ncbi:MAG TPA: pirin-like C-terminal cupin domain-containing protein [Polyangiaceae bacterium]|nr:pirin-like C-terminal cupin domain-containing protein [Polyangiaceae bacterium]